MILSSLLADEVRQMEKDSPLRTGTKCCVCDSQNKPKGLILLTGYAEGKSDIVLCRSCALQLSRKLLEDVCALEGDRHG